MTGDNLFRKTLVALMLLAAAVGAVPSLLENTAWACTDPSCTGN